MQQQQKKLHTTIPLAGIQYSIPQAYVASYACRQVKTRKVVQLSDGAWYYIDTNYDTPYKLANKRTRHIQTRAHRTVQFKFQSFAKNAAAILLWSLSSVITLESNMCLFVKCWQDKMSIGQALNNHDTCSWFYLHKGPNTTNMVLRVSSSSITTTCIVQIMI